MKTFKITVFGLITVSLLFSPFFMPEEWVYIEKRESILNGTWEIVAWTALWLLSFFAGIGILTFYKDIFKD